MVDPIDVRGCQECPFLRAKRTEFLFDKEAAEFRTNPSWECAATGLEPSEPVVDDVPTGCPILRGAVTVRLVRHGKPVTPLCECGLHNPCPLHWYGKEVGP